MGSLGPELTLFSRFSAEFADRFFSTIPPEARKGYVQGLSEEMKKIVAFRRDLPITNEIMEQVVMLLNTKLDLCEKSVSEPVLEEFIPMKSSSSEEEMMEMDEKSSETTKKKENEIVTSTDKRELASFLQLGNSNNNQNQCPNTPQRSTSNRLGLKLENNDIKKLGEDIKWPLMSNLNPHIGERVPVRTTAFMPFKGAASSIPVMKAKDAEIEVPKLPGLTLCTPEMKKVLREDVVCNGFNSKSSSSGSGSPSGNNVQSQSFVLPNNSQSHSARKQRRCWSPELHRRFVNALQQLGGAQVATPKQIRELMQVDGLTNDEVKSHLQKYRLHSRKSSNKKGYTGPLDLWPSPESGETSKPTPSQSGSPTGPLDSRDEYEEKNESNWKNQIHLCG